MLGHRAPLSLLGVALGSFVVGAFCGSPSHSLCYFYLHLPEPSWGLPQSFIRGYLDDQPIARFDSLTRKMEPLVPWMEEVEKEAFLAPERVFRADLEKLSKLDHQAEGLHTWQVVLGCELMEDGSKGWFLHYGYKGMDFISFDKETLRWVAAQPQAQKVKDKWEEDPGWSERNKFFLEETCIEGLQSYLSYRNKTLQRIEPPVGKVTRKVVDDSLEVLICQAFGFYPEEIRATWTRDGEACKYETLPRNVVPNSDGTYYVWLSIEIDPKERHRFQCHLEHEGLQEPLILAFKEETGRWIFGVIVVAIVLGAGILFLLGFLCRILRNYLHPKVTTCRDQAPSQSILYSPGTMQKLRFKDHSCPKLTTSEYKASHGLQKTWTDPGITVLSLHKQEGKQLQKSKMWNGRDLSRPRPKQQQP
ncbi:major histocompatibility complex class I-related gene protein-like isoform X2 [Pantherophis guttatus]|uniref:Major histocompatibility complex class I-related gene protein-like isoform X2 n=1 Tax=Pantherophis guttatus TaxID=94885 RepID=A0ABM3ZM11_PANGU|nr:major histocompatibility complex class I-related gene protein-like isoform X2 [Pantherophis guttatus]